MNSKTKFFLGADSNNGFTSYFRQLQEQKSSMQLLILKGGPGSGKSTLMKRIASFAESKGHILEIIPCASDPNSFDAVIDYTADFAIMDGTAPHTEDPSVPGARHHILYTGDLWDTDKLSRDGECIRELSGRISDCHRGASAYIGAAAKLLSENMHYSQKFLRKDKLSKLTKELSGKLSGGECGNEKIRLLSAVSVGEIKFFSETVSSFADNIYVIKDSLGGVSDFILKALSQYAKLDGAEFIFCPCAVIPGKCDHLIFPSKRIAILTENSFIKVPYGKKINAEDFYAPLPLTDDLLQREKDSEALLARASGLIEKAKTLHDELELYYRNAMNFDSMDEIFSSILKRFYRQ